MNQINESTELIKIINESKVEETTALTLKNSFIPFFDSAKEWEQKAKTIVVTDISQTDEMKKAREARLQLKDIRIKADKKRKELKEDSLRYGKAVQGVYNIIEYLIIPIEKYLEEQEKFAEIQEEKRKTELRIKRESEIFELVEFFPCGLDFGTMSEKDYEKLIAGAKIQLQMKIDAEKKAEEEKIKKEKEEAEEREKQRLENIRLKEEAAAREKILEAEREKARKEAAAREKIENEIKLQKEKEIREAKEKAEAERKAQNAPDKIKLAELAKVISEIKLPELKSAEAKKILSDVRELLSKVTLFINNKTDQL